MLIFPLKKTVKECAECVELAGGTYRLNRRKEVFDVA